MIWWDGEDICCCLSGRVVGGGVDWKSGGKQARVRSERKG